MGKKSTRSKGAGKKGPDPEEQEVEIAGISPKSYNIFAGSDIGYLKGISLGSKNFHNINSVEKLSKRLGINCMCWGNNSMILAGCKGGDVVCHNAQSGISKYLAIKSHEEHTHSNPSVILQEICSVEDSVVTAFSDGYLFVNGIKYKKSSATTSEITNFNSLPEAQNDVTLQCMDHNLTFKHQLATGGQENPLRVWDLNNFSKPIFKAKNVRNDWLSLRVPVWVTKAKFYPDTKSIVTGTGQGKVRMYDPISEQKRPVIEVQCREENPITALEIRPNSDYHIFVGNTLGTLQVIDLRKKAVLKAFKGNKGGITDIKFHPTYPVFAVSSVDRYVRCYDPDQKPGLLHSFYLNSSLNCILFSSSWKIEDYGDAVQVKEKELEDVEDDSETVSGAKKHKKDDSDDEGDDVWNKMEVVQTKKMKLSK